MEDAFAGIIDRFVLSSDGFERTLRTVRPEQWTSPTPCTEWTVRNLVNHMTRGNLSYVHLVEGGSAAEFLRLRDDAVAGSLKQALAELAEATADPRRSAAD